nr:phospholipase-like protein [Tanacetum cinerariifolium]
EAKSKLLEAAKLHAHIGRQIDDDENVPLNYYINNDLHIQFGREKFCIVTRLRFGVKNREEYDTQANLPFRRRVFSSHLDGQPITGIDVANAIAGPTFVELYDDDAVGLCCLGILQLVLLGAKSRRNVPEVAAWSKKNGRFLAEMVIPFFEGEIPAARLTPDDNEARSYRWISSRAYFDGFIDQVERVPFDLSRQNMYEIPSDIYRQFVEQKIEHERNRKDVDDIKEQMLKFKEEMNARSVRQENTVPINVGQHYGFNDFSQFQSMHGGLSSFKGHANSSFFNMGTPSNFQTPMRSQPGSFDWQRQMPEQSASQYWQPSPQPVLIIHLVRCHLILVCQICKPLLRRNMMLMA